MEKKYDIFISYSTKDREQVLSVVENLRAYGYCVWMDKEGIRSGDPSFKRTLVEAIEDAHLVLFFSSQNSNNSEWTAKEIGIAVEQRKYIIPIKLDSTPYGKSVKFDLVNCDYIDYSSMQKRREASEKLYSSISSKLGRQSTTEFHKQANETLVKIAEKYRTGNGVPRDYSFAAALYKKAADQGNPIAQCNLASMYAKGLGVSQNMNIAFTLYRMASNGGSALATYKLAEMYMQGEIITKDMNRAILLFQQSSDMGCSQATHQLKRLGIIK